MPNPTTNYTWTMPTEGGSTGTWDTILNAAIEDIDADLYTVSRQRYAMTQRIGGNTGFEASTLEDFWDRSTSHNVEGTGASSNPWYLPLTHIIVGMKITAFSSYGKAATGTTCVMSLVHVAEDGTETVVSAGHNMNETTYGAVTTSGLTHTVLADKAYFIKMVNSGPGKAILDSVSVTTTAV